MTNKIPLGIEDYQIAQDYYYVDKTILIKELIEEYNGKSLLVTRPRRFGKSLNLSMIEYFFNNNIDSSELFKDKKIWEYKTIIEKNLNKYPVIRINLKGIIANNYISLTNQIIDLISKVYKKYSYILDSEKLFDSEKHDILEIISKKAKDPFQYSTSIYDLSSYLSRIHNTKVVILIDEYDMPIQTAYENGFYDEAISFFKSFYSSTLKGNEYLYFSLVTGVLEIGKESLFSGLNNLSVNSISDKKMIEYFGFIENEVKEIVEYFDLKDDYKTICTWYGGYGNGDVVLYNPWSVLSYIERGEFSYYWVNTSTNTLVNNLIQTNESGIKDNMEIFASFLNNTHIKIDFNARISYRDINNNLDSLLSFLVQAGYLSARKESDGYSVFIPNHEIMHVFKNEIIGANFNGKNISITTKLKEALTSASEDEIKKILEKYILTSFSYLDLTKEKDYQILVTGILATLFDEYVVKSEVNSKNGRCDIMVSPKIDDRLGIIIEIKKYKSRVSNAKLKIFASKALEQIKEKEYYQELKERNAKKIIIYGFAFDDNKMEVASEEL